MKSYTVSFIKYYTYTVTAETEDEAINKAEDIFYDDCCSPVADTSYDDIEVQEDDEDEI